MLAYGNVTQLGAARADVPARSGIAAAVVEGRLGLTERVPKDDLAVTLHVLIKADAKPGPGQDHLKGGLVVIPST